MGGKSRKTGGISKKLIDRIKAGESLTKKTSSNKKCGKKIEKGDPFDLSKDA